MSAKQYTESQMLCGLREVWADATGNDDPFDADTQIVAFMKADGTWDDIDLADVFWRLERFFGFQCTRDEWKQFMGHDIAQRSLHEWERTVVPQLTFGVLAQFIIERAPAISFEPISILGRECAPAGAFTGIQQLAERVTGTGRPFGPSTPIIEVLQGEELDRFWTPLHWMTEKSIPELPTFWRNGTGLVGCLGGAAVIAVVLNALANSDPTWIIPTLVIALVCYSATATFRDLANPLPPHLVTFRDLSMLIAESRNARSAS